MTGTIPSQLGQLQGASVLLKTNDFDDKTAPLSLCMLLSVNEFDLANETAFCPLERNALSDFYDSAKGGEWTDGTNWKDEYASFCDWKGVTCDDGKNHVTKLNLTNNGLSGRLSESIGDLTFIKELDLSDNDIKVMELSVLVNANLLFLYSNSRIIGINPDRDWLAFQPHLPASQLQCLYRSCTGRIGNDGRTSASSITKQQDY